MGRVRLEEEKKTGWKGEVKPLDPSYMQPWAVTRVLEINGAFEES